MIHRVTCDRCGSISEYDDKSIWEGNREHEDIECPVCGNIIDSAFTDLTPVARLIAFCTLWRSQMRFRAVALRSITAARF